LHDPDLVVVRAVALEEELRSVTRPESLDVGVLRRFGQELEVRSVGADGADLGILFVAVVEVDRAVTRPIGLAALDLGLAEYDRERVDGHRLTLAGARVQLDRLAALPLAERRALPALEPERAPVIVAGAIILVGTLAHLGLDDVEVSERDILEGIAFAAAELPEPEEGAAPPGAFTCC